MRDIGELITVGEAALRLLANQVPEGEVFITRSSSRSISIENNALKSIRGGGEIGIGLRILKDGRIGFSHANDLASVPDAIRLAIKGAAISPEKPFAFPAHQTYPTIPDLLDKRVLDLSMEQSVELARNMIEAARDVHPAIHVSGGGFSTSETEVVILNTAGLEVSEHLSGIGASLFTVYESDHPSSGHESDASHLLLRDVEEVGRRAADLALRGQDKVKIGAGTLPVILKPDVLADFMRFIIAPALHGIRAERGESVYSDRKGERIMHPDLTLVDDPSMPDGDMAMRMDDEGIPSRCHTLVANGELMDYLYTIGTGAEYNHSSTSSGIRGGGQDHSSPVVTSCRNLMLQGNTRDEEALVSEIDQGLMVHDIMGAHTANPVSGDFSVTGSILFLIEKGEVTRPVSQAMISGNFPDLLTRVSGLANNYRKISGGLAPGGFYLPSVRIDDVRVIGET